MIIHIIILALAIPAGFILAWMARDELIVGRKWFKAIIIISILAGIWFFLTKQIPIALTAIFITIATFISLTKSYDKKWTKKK